MVNRLKYLVIHCTATPEGREVSKEDIFLWHVKERGWKKPGYSDIIHLDGKIENLIPHNQDNVVDKWEISNGARGYNRVSRHLCYVGGCDVNMKEKDTRTDEQKYALECYVKEFLLRFPDVEVIGHNEINRNKFCPSFNVAAWLKQINIKFNSRYV